MNTRTTPKDFFLHLGAIIALFASVISIINLSFSIINYYLPDQLAGYFYAGSIAWPVSMLVVLVPLLYVLEYLINKDIGKIPEKADLAVRKWRIYLTLFLTGATIIGDLVALIYTYMSGEVSGRFIYKVIAVLVISSVVFFYYLLVKNRRDETGAVHPNTKKAMIFAYIGIVVFAVSIVLGFMVVGSPSKQRNLRFDSQRISDLSSIQWRVISHWQQKGALPASLEELNDPISNYPVPTDPKNKNPYGYRVISSNTAPGGKVSFELCAEFALKSGDDKGRGDYYGKGGGIYMDSMAFIDYPGVDSSWKHDAGLTCFERTIDPDKYPVNPKPSEYRQ